MKNTNDFYSKFLDLCSEHNASPVEGVGVCIGKVVTLKQEKRVINPTRNKIYLAYITSLPCEGYPNECSVEYAVQAHHVGPHAMGQKTDDYRTIPLCYKCHDNWHKKYHGEDVEYYTEVMLGHLINFLKIK